MEYYKLLRLEKEPFSNSPDPDYFFQSRQHLSCIQKLEVALRLKRGLNVVMGDVGTGKTTLCREVIRRFAGEPDVETHLILDPAIPTADEFLTTIHSLLCDLPPEPMGSALEKKEAIKQALFEKGVKEKKTVVLIIDEGQKISPVCMEILRELLNYETNTYKLLQIAIFAQKEFTTVLEAHPNFADRINLLHHLAPMNFGDTCRMIHHRLKLASESPKPVRLFTLPALWAIYLASKGYPRRIIHLCHQSVLAMVIQNRTRAGWALIRSCKRRLAPVSRFGFPAKTALAALFILILCAAGMYYLYPRWKGDPQRQARIFPIPTPFQSISSNTDPVIDPGPASEIKSTTKTDEIPEQVISHPQTSSNTLTPATEEIVFSVDTQIETIATTVKASDPVDGPTQQPAQIAGLSAENNTPSHESNLPASAPPDILGQLRVNYGDTLYNMVTRVYGIFRLSLLATVVEANPFIIDPDAIETDQLILFPAITFEPNPLLSQCAWIVLDRYSAMDQAMARLPQLAAQAGLPVRMIAGWTAAKDLQYNLVLQDYFTNNDRAVAFLDQLPEALAARADIIIDWPAKTRLFGDPYIGGIR